VATQYALHGNIDIGTDKHAKVQLVKNRRPGRIISQQQIISLDKNKSVSAIE
jgi:hypothetical protein